MHSFSFIAAVIIGLNASFGKAVPTTSTLSPRYYRLPSLPYPGTFSPATCPVSTNFFLHGTFHDLVDRYVYPRLSPEQAELHDKAVADHQRVSSRPACAVIGQIIMHNVSNPEFGSKLTYSFDTPPKCTYTFVVRADTLVKSIEAELKDASKTVLLNPSIAIPKVEPNTVNATIVFRAAFDGVARYILTFEPGSAAGVNGYAALFQTCDKP